MGSLWWLWLLLLIAAVGVLLYLRKKQGAQGK